MTNLNKGYSHITGGGFIENIPRMLPEGLKAQIEKDPGLYIQFLSYFKVLVI